LTRAKDHLALQQLSILEYKHPNTLPYKMEAYTLVDKEAENTQENEIRVKVDGQVSKYLRYAFRVLNK